MRILHLFVTRTKQRRAGMLVLVLMCITPVPATGKVTRYGDNATPYPLYCGMWGKQPAYTDAELTLLATHFDGMYGSFSLTRAQADRLWKIHPDFALVSYTQGPGGPVACPSLLKRLSNTMNRLIPSIFQYEQARFFLIHRLRPDIPRSCIECP